MRCLFAIASTLALAVPSMLTAADTTGSGQIRLSLGSVPGLTKAKEETTFAGSTVTNDVDMKDGKGGNLEIGYEGLWIKENRPVGLGAYAGVFFRNQEGTDEVGTKASVGSFGVNLGLDLAIRPIPEVLLTAGPRLGLGGASQKIDSPYYKDASGSMVSIALQLGGYVTIQRFVLGVEGGYMSWQSKATHDYNDGTFVGTVDETMSGNGGYGALVLGVGF